MNTIPLRERQCLPATELLSQSLIEEMLELIHSDWYLDDSGQSIIREFAFSNFYETMAFVNAVAWIANTQDHHPEMSVGYNRCKIEWSTHSVGGLSENDFICAAHCDAL